MKKNNNTNNGLFDITMGSYVGAEAAELAGLYLLHKIKCKCFGIKEVGLYRDDGLAIVDGPGLRTDRVRKELIRLFKEEDLQITVENNTKRTDYLDVVLDLENRTFRPYRKTNDQTVYIHHESNHPPIIIKNLPRMIAKRVSTLSSSKEIFEQEIGFYKQALMNSGFKNPALEYQPMVECPKKTRRMNIIWFNPPYCSTVKLNIGEIFLKLVDKHLATNEKLGKHFNRKTIKLSYSTTRNTRDWIQRHNQKILDWQGDEPNVKPCNCRNMAECPLENKCNITREIVYQATVTTSTGVVRKYIGLTKNTFKTRYTQHKSTFNHKTRRTDTELANYIWKLKEEGLDFTIKWTIKRKAYAYRSGSKYCDLCLSEKTEIALAHPSTSLNSRREIVSTCRHKRKFLLLKCKPPTPHNGGGS